MTGLEVSCDLSKGGDYDVIGSDKQTYFTAQFSEGRIQFQNPLGPEGCKWAIVYLDEEPLSIEIESCQKIPAREWLHHSTDHPDKVHIWEISRSGFLYVAREDGFCFYRGKNPGYWARVIFNKEQALYIFYEPEGMSMRANIMSFYSFIGAVLLVKFGEHFELHKQ